MTVYFCSGVIEHNARYVASFNGVIDADPCIQTTDQARKLMAESVEMVKAKMIKSGQWQDEYQVVLNVLNPL